MTSMPAPRRRPGCLRRASVWAGLVVFEHRRTVIAALLLVLGGASVLRAQGVGRVHTPLPTAGLSVIPRGILTFKRVLPGIPYLVSVHDVRQAGRFEIKGPPEAAVRVELILPDAMTTDAGARLILAFGAHDGFVDSSVGLDQLFNPHMAVVASLGPGGKLMILLGGTALPDRLQTKGIYRATIFVTVSDVGI